MLSHLYPPTALAYKCHHSYCSCSSFSGVGPRLDTGFAVIPTHPVLGKRGHRSSSFHKRRKGASMPLLISAFASLPPGRLERCKVFNFSHSIESYGPIQRLPQASWWRVSLVVACLVARVQSQVPSVGLADLGPLLFVGLPMKAWHKFWEWVDQYYLFEKKRWGMPIKIKIKPSLTHQTVKIIQFWSSICHCGDVGTWGLWCIVGVSTCAQLLGEQFDRKQVKKNCSYFTTQQLPPGQIHEWLLTGGFPSTPTQPGTISQHWRHF